MGSCGKLFYLSVFEVYPRLPHRRKGNWRATAVNLPLKAQLTISKVPAVLSVVKGPLSFTGLAAGMGEAVPNQMECCKPLPPGRATKVGSGNSVDIITVLFLPDMFYSDVHIL